MPDVSSTEMTCRELVEVLTDYLEGRLAEPARTLLEEHLHTCQACVMYIEQFRLTIATMGELRDDEIPDDQRDALLEAFRGWNAGAGRPTATG